MMTVAVASATSEVVDSSVFVAEMSFFPKLVPSLVDSCCVSSSLVLFDDDETDLDNEICW